MIRVLNPYHFYIFINSNNDINNSAKFIDTSNLIAHVNTASWTATANCFCRFNLNCAAASYPWVKLDGQEIGSSYCATGCVFTYCFYVKKGQIISAGNASSGYDLIAYGLK